MKMPEPAVAISLPTKPPARVAVMQCGTELYIELCTALQDAITGKPVFCGDSLADLVRRHCPDIYAMARKGGFKFVPSLEPRDLESTPPQIWFDVFAVDSAVA
jgi:hypothetical protein